MRSIVEGAGRSWRRLLALARLDRRVAEGTEASAIIAARLEVLIREQRLVARQLTLPAEELWRGGPAPLTDGTGTNRRRRRSSVCRQEDLETPWFAEWLSRLGYTPRYHRKLWEYAFIGEALDERGLLRAGSRGLGFGVGSEPLSAYFASRGCRIVGTDLASHASAAASWSATRQHAAGKEALRAPHVCPDDVFDARVEFRACDMNAIPPDLTGFDFCWSACALEHLGTLEAGLTFIERSLDCLAPGGVAVHTTELNLLSNEATLSSGPTVIYRRRDLEALFERLRARGCHVEPFDFDAGSGPLDRYVDLPPYLDEPHLRLAIEGVPATSVGLIIVKGSAMASIVDDASGGSA